MPKKKGTPGGNPSPIQNDRLKAHQFDRADKGEGVLAAKQTQVKLFAEDEAALADLFPDPKKKAAWLRSLIHEALKN